MYFIIKKYIFGGFGNNLWCINCHFNIKDIEHTIGSVERKSARSEVVDHARFCVIVVLYYHDDVINEYFLQIPNEFNE